MAVGHAILFGAMNELERITINPDQCGGRPCIRGMRIRVKDVLDMLAGGATQEEILADFQTSNPTISAPASPTRHAILTTQFSSPPEHALPRGRATPARPRPLVR